MSFKRALGLFDATMLVAGSMIGSGIFIVSADIARITASPMLLLVVWGITGLITITAALSYGELAGMMPEAGGQYVYLREAFGPLAGFLYGWTLFTVIQTGTIAAVAMAFAKYTGLLQPFFAEDHRIFSIGTWGVSWAQVLAIATILFLTAVNARGVSVGKIIQNVFTSTKVISVVALALLGIIIGRGSDAFHMNMSGVTDLVPSEPLALLPMLAVAMVGSIFSSDAWNNITFAAAEVKDPKKTIPLSLLYGVLLVTVLYLLANIAYLCLMPLNEIASAQKDRVGAAAAQVMFGPPGATIMAILIMVSTFGCNNGLILSGARAYYAMALDKLFFKKAGELSEKQVPRNALWIQAAWASALCLSGTYGNLLDYVVMAVLLFYIATIAGIFRLRKTQPNAPRPYKAFGYPVLPALYILAATFICVSLLMYKQEYSLPGLVIVLLGVPVYYVWGRKAARG
ncbi:MAG: amino acid permease [Bacteroidetes bacterium]|nr:amino acid permease [Bacteroidota bacterium]